MKVLHLISGGDSGGAKTHVLSLLQDLNRTVTADLVCYMEGDFSREARERGIPTTVIADSFPVALRKTREIIKNGGYELVHCHGSRANLTGSLLKGGFSIPFISTVHSDYKLDYLGRPMANLTYGKLNGMSLRKMDYLVCVSDNMKNTLIPRGFEPNRMFAIYNGVNFGVEQRRVDRGEWLKEIGCGFGKDDVIVGIAARLDPVKDVATLVRGFAWASGEFDRLRLLIAGDGQEREMLEALARELGVAEKVFFAGWLTNMDGYYSTVDINVISSLSETFPYAVTEAARAKIPTAASRVGGLPELLIQDETGMLFDPGDCDTLAEALVTLASDPELRRRMGEAVYAKAKKDFSAEGTCRRQIEIYETVISRYNARKTDRREGLVICGAYGHGNAGDEAILSGIIRRFRSLYKDIPITVISRSPKNTRLIHGVNAIGRGNLIRQARVLRRSRLYISGGGSLLQDATSRRSLWFYLYSISSAKRLGCKVQMYGCGIGPLNFEGDRKLSASVMNKYVDVITLREPGSLELLKELGVTGPEILLAADPALSIGACSETRIRKFMEENGLSEDGKYICLGLRSWAGFEEKIDDIAGAVRYAAKELGLTPVFMPMNYGRDRAISTQVAAKLNIPYVLLPEIREPELAIGLMSKMTVVVAMRLHSLLFAVSCGVPAIGISYDPKVSEFVKYIGFGSCLELDGLNEAELIRQLDLLGRADNRVAIEEKLKKVRDAEALNILTAKRLIDID